MASTTFKDFRKVGNGDTIEMVDYSLELPGELTADTTSADFRKNASLVADAWRRGGRASDDTYVPWAGFFDALVKERDAKRNGVARDNASVTTGNFINMLEVATSTVVREQIEPILAITGLFQTVR